MSSAAPKTVQRTPFKRWCDENTGLFFLIPWILGFLIFKAYPFASSLVYSFTDLNFFKGISQYGLMNYVEIFTSRKTVSVLLTTVKYAFITVPLKLVFALFIAYILNFKIKFVNLFRTVYYIPVHPGRFCGHCRSVACPVQGHRRCQHDPRLLRHCRSRLAG